MLARLVYKSPQDGFDGSDNCSSRAQSPKINWWHPIPRTGKPDNLCMVQSLVLLSFKRVALEQVEGYYIAIRESHIQTIEIAFLQCKDKAAYIRLFSDIVMQGLCTVDLFFCNQLGKIHEHFENSVD